MTAIKERLKFARTNGSFLNLYLLLFLGLSEVITVAVGKAEESVEAVSIGMQGKHSVSISETVFKNCYFEKKILSIIIVVKVNKSG